MFTLQLRTEHDARRHPRGFAAARETGTHASAQRHRRRAEALPFAADCHHCEETGVCGCRAAVATASLLPDTLGLRVCARLIPCAPDRAPGQRHAHSVDHLDAELLVESCLARGVGCGFRFGWRLWLDSVLGHRRGFLLLEDPHVSSTTVVDSYGTTRGSWRRLSGLRRSRRTRSARRQHHQHDQSSHRVTISRSAWSTP